LKGRFEETIGHLVSATKTLKIVLLSFKYFSWKMT
jgi:hypothetical protein